MADKEVRITCPCCQTELRVDLLTGKVVRWLRASDAPGGGASDADARWSDLHDRVKGRIASSQDKLDSALERERARKNELDGEFDRAAQRAKKPRGDTT